MKQQPKPTMPIVEAQTWTSPDNTVELHSTKLLYCDAQDLFADLTSVVAPGAGAFQGGVADRGQALAMIMNALVGGRYVTYQCRLLAGTTLIARGQGGGQFDMGSREALNRAFASDRDRYMIPAVKLALEVNYKSFLGGFALIGFDPVTMSMTSSSSEDSSQSTSATG